MRWCSHPKKNVVLAFLIYVSLNYLREDFEDMITVTELILVIVIFSSLECELMIFSLFLLLLFMSLFIHLCTTQGGRQQWG